MTLAFYERNSSKNFDYNSWRIPQPSVAKDWSAMNDHVLLIDHLGIVIKQYRNGVFKKEVCNGGVACSLLKLGSLEKTVIAFLFHSGLHSGTIFLWKKRCHMLFWGTTGYAILWQKKRPRIFMMPNWFFDHLQLFSFQPFFDQVPNKGSALENPCQSWTKMEESRLWGS